MSGLSACKELPLPYVAERLLLPKQARHICLLRITGVRGSRERGRGRWCILTLDTWGKHRDVLVRGFPVLQKMLGQVTEVWVSKFMWEYKEKAKARQSNKNV